jgi:hypothetical protein
VDTYRQARQVDRRSDEGTPVTYRTAWLGLAVSVVFLGGWCVAAGMELWATLVQLLLMFIALFGVAKYAAATGFTFLSPGGNLGTAGDKGGTVWMQLGGTASLSPSTLTAVWMVNHNALAGIPIRLTGTVAVAHYFRNAGRSLSPPSARLADGSDRLRGGLRCDRG